MKNDKKPEPLVLPDKVRPVLHFDGRHKAVPLMADDVRFSDEEKQPFHPRLGHISHGFGHATHKQAEQIAKEIALRYNSYPRLLRAVQDFVLDCNNGLGPSVDRLRIAIDAENNISSKDTNHKEDK